MLAYAARERRAAGRSASPKALTLIIAGHAVLIAAVMTAKMDVIGPVIDEIPNIINVAPPPAPKPPPPQIEPRPTQEIIQDSSIDRTQTIVDMGQTTSIELDKGPPIRDLLKETGAGIVTVRDPPRHVPVLAGPRLATAADALKPPYPNDKLRLEEEATLRLKLTIDERGRVIAVEPVGHADPSFLAAARRHILKSWRYKPATEDGVGVTSTAVINLSFRLEEA